MLETNKPREKLVSPDTVINDIYAGRRNISVEEFIEYAGGEPEEIAVTWPERTLLQYGSKVLILGIDRQKKTAQTLVKTVGEEKQKNETTLLYRAAQKVMQEIANAEGMSFKYTLRTSNEKLAQWAQSSGNDIFGWQEQKDVANAFVCKTTIEPQDS